eukprot:TRINITY_DN9917_c0_g1_i16.p3 TRINITY_DN9917_c0_g1~~TRINITY_DN9917_c0_g1_i16.p3  ORF type:complete len:107 (-),score=38.95 TRINITY_DN9917_c0_g1_i16:25-345(-)
MLDELETMVEYCRKLRFEETPDYGYLYRLIRTVFEKKNLKFDFKYDWSIPHLSTTEASSNAVEPLRLFGQGILNAKEDAKQEEKRRERSKKEVQKEKTTPDLLVEQ